MSKFFGGLVGGVVGGIVGVLLVLTYLQAQPAFGLTPLASVAPAPAPAATVPPAATTAPPAPAGLYDEQALADVYERVSPSVVSILSRVNTPLGDRHPAAASGTGFVLDQDGHILTNNHVVDQASALEALLSDGTRVPAQVLGRDASQDLAVIKIDVPRDKLHPAVLGDSSKLRVGQLALAIGHPFGLDRTFTVGVVSSLGRFFAPDPTARVIANMIQTDAAINPGNSGGPLLNSKGEVIGINTAIENPTGSAVFVGIGFAVPINTAKDRLGELIAGKTLQPPWLGISGQPLTAALVKERNLSVSEGVLVGEAMAGGPAARAGLKANDVIIAVDQTKVKSVEEIIAYLDGKRPGQAVTLTALRDGHEVKLDVTLGEWPSNQR